MSAVEATTVVAAAVVPEPEIPDGLTPSEEDELAEPSEDEGESHEVDGSVENGVRYSAELSDQELTELWAKTPDALGSISIGFVDEGRIVNAYQFPPGEGYVVVQPEKAWATRETVQAVIAAITEVKRQHPDAPALRVNQLSGAEGGHLRPHKSHQNGRDVDLGFYYPTAETNRAREREKYIDPARNWALLKALVTQTDVQMILVDRRVQKVIYDHALSVGEDKAWLDSLFRAGTQSIIRHARRHRDHFHVRFYNARAQELGRRVAPLLAMRPEQNLRMHRVRKGDTLGGIAVRYGTTVSSIKKANRMRSSFLRISQVLRVPLRGPCTRCPIPPAVQVPPRRLPPGFNEAQQVAQARSVVAAPAEEVAEVTQSQSVQAVAAEVSDSAEDTAPVVVPAVLRPLPGPR